MYKLKALTIRTDNSNDGMAAIVELWDDILTGKLPVSFKESGKFPISKYDHYESNEQGAFDLTIMEVTPAFIVQKEKEVREGSFRKYETHDPDGDTVKCTQEAWRQVWNDQSRGVIHRSFTNDYEMVIPKDFTEDHAACCRLYIAVK